MSEQDPIIPGENQDNKPNPPADLDPEIQRRDAQIAHHREKAEKVLSDFEAYKLKNPPKEEPPANPPQNDSNFKAPTDPLEVVRLGKALNGFDEDETDFIIRNAKSKDIDGIIKATQDEMVQMAIKSRREKVAKENKIPPPGSGGSAGFNAKSSDEIQKMTRDEHIAYEKQLMEQSKAQGGV